MSLGYKSAHIETNQKTAVFIYTALVTWNMIFNSISCRIWHATDMYSLVMAARLRISEALLNKLDIQVTMWCFPIILIPTLHFERPSPFGEALGCSLEDDSQWYSTLPPSNRGCFKIQVARLASPCALFWMPHSIYNTNELSVSTTCSSDMLWSFHTQKWRALYLYEKRQNINFHNLFSPMNAVTVFVSFSDKKQLIFFVVLGTDTFTSRQILSFFCKLHH